MKNATGQPLCIRGLAKRYGGVDALLPTDLIIREGEFLTLLGPSGSGKTTLLNMIAGYLVPTAGSIHIGSRDVTKLPARHRNIGMVFQSYALFPHMTVGGNVAYGLEVRKRPSHEIKQRVGEALELVQLSGMQDRPVQLLSGGQQQRVALARALVIEPDVLLMDEPLGALDKQLRRAVQIEIRRLHEKNRYTTIYVTHDQEEALVLSDRIAVLANGCIQQIGTAEEIYCRPVNRFVAEFIGESNILPVDVRQVNGQSAEVGIPDLGLNASVPAMPGITSGEKASILLRPECLSVSTTGEGVSAIVADAIYLGEMAQYHLKLASGAQIVVRQFASSPMSAGQSVALSWRTEDGLILP